MNYEVAANALAERLAEEVRQSEIVKARMAQVLAAEEAEAHRLTFPVQTQFSEAPESVQTAWAEALHVRAQCVAREEEEEALAAQTLAVEDEEALEEAVAVEEEEEEARRLAEQEREAEETLQYASRLADEREQASSPLVAPRSPVVLSPSWGSLPEPPAPPVSHAAAWLDPVAKPNISTV